MNYHFYRPFLKNQWYDDNVTSKVQKMCKWVAVEMKNQTFNGKNLFS